MAGHEVPALWALAAGELDADERARVEAHVAGCAECARELERMKQTRAVMHEAREVTPEVRWEEVDAKVVAAARGALRRQPSSWLSRAQVATMASALRLPGARTPAMASATPRSRLPWALMFAGACAVVLGFWLLRTPEVTPGPEVAVVREGDGVPGTAVRDDGAGAEHADGARGSASSGNPSDVPSDNERLDMAQAEHTAGAMVREAGGAERALQTGTKLRSGVAVRTPSRSTALLRLPDASRVHLSSGSEVELSRAEARDVHLRVKQGRLSVQASHAQREKFLVEAAGLRVSVVGTVFTVERTEHGAAVAVAEGRVRVEAEGQPARFVSAGERVELDDAQKTLKHAPVSEHDRRAFAELSAPVQGNTVATEAVAQKTQAPAPEKPAVATKEPRQQVAPATPRAGGKAAAQKEHPALPEETPVRPQAVAEAAPTAVPLTPPGAEPDQEFAPYPAKSVTEQLPPKTATEPPPAVAEAPTRNDKNKKEPPVPLALLSNDADERFLGYARMQLSPRTCESFLIGLEEIAQRSPRQAHREQARYLRARCFEEKLQPKAAKSEYRQYLNEFPRGRYVREAKTALLP
ncbi:FecR domain-containing protein [Pyxidicoccus parkwayensis]|uniref:FecR domain-containing protein n=1 Tax=Pyxidicoccus parkwayensis TaxID=2813578 RepID=A0ABX7NP95_9BACT|nr:FecR domain-containing protein [Pyxidicoccus parkwaysis]QSQ19264.1 FecR domain-containing protein [Pyxidicoccus parkwaysis]